MRIQNTADGMLRKSIVRLQPKQAAMKPKVSEPHMAPIDVIDPTQDTSMEKGRICQKTLSCVGKFAFSPCSFVNGPDTSGVSGEMSFGSAGDIQPKIVPKNQH